MQQVPPPLKPSRPTPTVGFNLRNNKTQDMTGSLLENQSVSNGSDANHNSNYLLSNTQRTFNVNDANSRGAKLHQSRDT